MAIFANHESTVQMTTFIRFAGQRPRKKERKKKKSAQPKKAAMEGLK